MMMNNKKKKKQTAKKEGNQETNLRENINSKERRIISKTAITRPLKKTTLA